MTRRLLTLSMLMLSLATAEAQPQLQADEKRLWAGELLWKQPKTVSFPFTNDGDSALVIRDVRASCGCVSVDYPRTPVLAGKTGLITATYDAALLGSFYKELAVYTNASDRPTWLAFEGRVVVKPSDTDYETSFPIDLGSIRISTNVIEFDDVNKGDHPVAELQVLNLKKDDFTPQLMHLPQYLSAQYQPEVIQGGRVGKVLLTLDSEKLMMDGLNQASLYMARYPGDKVSPENEIVFAAVLLPSFKDLTAEKLERAPVISVSDEEGQLESLSIPVDRSKLTKKKAQVSRTVSVENRGETELEISAVQVFNRAVSVSLSDRKIAPHTKTKLKVSVDLGELKNTKSRPRLLIISNDPRSAKLLLGINIEE
ncbi:MAG: DUF1573 domain-containing protein [Prevotellaceae bacterium]|nr:DUF1573 domain-containing protein [Prevotellaceae bacterium]